MTTEEAARILDPSTSDSEFEKDISHWGERLDIARAMGAEALRSSWVRTEDRLPVKADGEILATNKYGLNLLPHYRVVDFPDTFTWWMPIPPLPEVEE